MLTLRGQGWSQSLAIGSYEFVRRFRTDMGPAATHRGAEEHGNSHVFREDTDPSTPDLNGKFSRPRVEKMWYISMTRYKFQPHKPVDPVKGTQHDHGFRNRNENSGSVGSKATRVITESNAGKVMTFYITGAANFVVGLYLSIKK